MPTYEFKCIQCKKNTELIISLGEFVASDFDQCMGTCKNKKCKGLLYKQNQQINFVGGINMNNSIKAKAYRKYSNKQGGPQGIIGGTSTGKATMRQGGKVVGRTGLI